MAAEERATAQPAHHAAGPAPLRLQGPDPRDPLPGRHAPRPSRRCSSATRRSCAASASRSRWAAWTPTSTTSRATGSAPTSSRCPTSRSTADEAAVIGLATRVWEHARLAEATTEAVRKLTALGVEVDAAALDIAAAPAVGRRAGVRRLLGGHPGAHAGRVRLPPLRAAPRTTTRHLQPWGVVRYSGRWYVVGLDTDRGAGAGLPALPGRRARRAVPARPGRTTSRPAPTSARPPSGSRRRPRPGGRSSWCAQRRRHRAAPRRRRRSRPTSPARRPHRLGPGPASAAAARGARRRGARLRRRRRTSRRPPSCAPRSSTGCAAVAVRRP